MTPTPEFLKRLEASLLAWRGTPYAPGQRCRGAGVDCVRFVTAVLDDILEQPPHDVKTLPNDGAMHDREGALAVLATIRGLYPCDSLATTAELEPGDVLVVGHKNGGPGHALIVGLEPCHYWHATRSGVARSGLSGIRAPFEIFGVYRLRVRA